ncbi:uncharacterized protein AB675_2358 [Cyphellophora attinorum]|uniref:Restriction of telomere capping protein 4 n=1 Tax=Cyphellophora attinorum TaxID=1664694 RepID=A0A0N1HHB6_9EURO|nr:uncharacterized protein AB675_2358 [Phialophora attinorum]KPI45353.1 hypothetical protein AB675_2358 [Phialophora attinorum]
MDEADINALPEDSSDNENVENETPSEPEQAAQVPSLVSKKRKPAKAASTYRSKKPRLSNQDDVVDQQAGDESMAEAPRTSQANEITWIPSGSQKKRALYGKQRSIPPPPQRTTSPKLRKTAAIPDAVSDNHQSHVSFKEYDTAIKEPERPKKQLKTYDMPAPASSITITSSGGSEATSLSEQPDEPNRSPLSSPATTPMSVKGDDEEESQQRRNLCPYCNKEIDRSRLEVPVDLNELRYAPIKDQQKFCREHSVADAQHLYEKNNYPAMKWLALKGRITKHIPKLKRILQREIDSHFLTQIDARLAGVKNRKQMRQFLDQQGKDVDAFPPGYYGPKGTHIMAEVIASKLSSSLSGKDVDDTLRRIGIGQYVQFVLVPECTALLVMEDMKVAEEEARVIMIESSHAGVLLHPEDEVVHRQDEED